MNVTLENLETHWKQYESWCKGNGLHPQFKDFLIWLDDHDLDIGQHDDDI